MRKTGLVVIAGLGKASGRDLGVAEGLAKLLGEAAGMGEPVGRGRDSAELVAGPRPVRGRDLIAAASSVVGIMSFQPRLLYDRVVATGGAGLGTLGLPPSRLSHLAREAGFLRHAAGAARRSVQQRVNPEGLESRIPGGPTLSTLPQRVRRSPLRCAGCPGAGRGGRTLGGQSDDESCAAAGAGAVCPDVAVVGPYQRAGDGQPDSAATGCPAAGRVGAIEAFEHVRQMFGRDAVTVVGDRHLNRTAPAGHRDLHVAAWGGVPQRIGEQVVEHFSQPVAVASKGGWRGGAQREGDALVVEALRGGAYRLGGQISEVQRCP